jgi:hypothetical protein
VTDEVNGTWQTAIEVPGMATLDTGGNAQVFSVSCGSAGNCTAGGFYWDSLRGQQAFVADEVNGIWQTAIEVPGTAILNTRGTAVITSVSCPSAGDCTAGGLYQDNTHLDRAFVADEINGVWQNAIEVPGTGAPYSGSAVNSVSCPSAGNCVAGGYFWDTGIQAFVADEVNGTWQTAIEVPGTAALNVQGTAQVSSVSCSSPGNCAAGGNYSDSSRHAQVFVADEVNGTWQTAIEVPDSATLNTGGRGAQVQSMSCSSAGVCAASGSYSDNGYDTKAFVATEVNGTWQFDVEAPNSAGSTADSVSCVVGGCTAGGFYLDSANRLQAFVTEPGGATWPPNLLGPSRPSPFAAQGFYLGVTSGNAWTLKVTQPNRSPGHVYTATIRSNDDIGYITNVAGIQLERDDSFKSTGRTITFLSHDFGDIDGIRFDTSPATTSLTFTLAIDGRPATATQIHLGVTEIGSATASPFTVAS